MDKTEQFIKMCDCPEIQSSRKPKIEKMNDGRWHKEWELEVGDFIGVYSTCNLLEIEIKGTTIYDPYFYSKKKDSDIDVQQVGFDEGDGYTARKIVWLPRQDQIQEMLSFHEDTSFLIHKFNKFCYQDSITNLIEGGSYLAFQFPISISMEQLWLAFYMCEKHKKKWDGEKWVKK